MSKSAREALLIGVGRFKGGDIPQLDVVGRDLAAMLVVLERSGYVVTVHTDGETLREMGEQLASVGHKPAHDYRPTDCNAADLIETIQETCDGTYPDRTLIIYLTGHGANLEGQDVFFGHDARRTDATQFRKTVVSLTQEIAPRINRSRAEATIVFVDACREDLFQKIDAKGFGLAEWTAGKDIASQTDRTAFVFGCDVGQFCRFPHDGPSHFTAALARALDPSYEARTLGQVIEATREMLSKLPPHRRQTVKFRSEPGDKLNSVEQHAICNAPPPDTWTTAALESPLWNMVPDSRQKEDLREAVRRIGKVCWAQHRRAVDELPEDPWRDSRYLPRVLKRLAESLQRINPPLGLEGAEVAALLATPLVREGVLAAGMARLAKVGSVTLEPDAVTDPVARDLIIEAHQRHRHFVRQARRLDKDGGDSARSDRDVVLAWLVHRAVARDPNLRQVARAKTTLPTDFLDELATLASASTLVRESLSPERLIRLAFAPPDDPSSLREKEWLNAEDGGYFFRARLLGDLLDLAGAMALDARELPELVVEHIGLVTDKLEPSDICNVVHAADWREYGNGLALHGTCPHPALDQALRDQVVRAEETRVRISGRYKDQINLNQLMRLPALLDKGLEPKWVDGRPAYSTPHLRFELDRNDVRELLMGEALYGDPNLAIRELYQNALDACRYRKARSRYDGVSYEGRIRFKQGVDQGRPYIECDDNGIGMSEHELFACFARAGRRFHDLPEFIQERTEWLHSDPPIELYPNSQFGIGVFSYFMLADEIQIWTRRHNRGSNIYKRLHVTVPGSGSLFRLREADDQSGDAGTRIRLYLSKTEHAGKTISCLDFLKNVLWVAEFDTEVWGLDRSRRWEPGKLHHPGFSDNEATRRINSIDAWIDAWWVEEEPALLSDGLKLPTDTSVGLSVINFRGLRRPRLSANRNVVLDLDQTTARTVLVHGVSELIGWSRLTMNWLLSLTGRSLRVADDVVRELIARDVSVLLVSDETSSSEIRLAETGCCEADSLIILGWQDERPASLESPSYQYYISSIRSSYNDYDKNIILQFVLNRLRVWKANVYLFVVKNINHIMDHIYNEMLTYSKSYMISLIYDEMTKECINTIFPCEAEYLLRSNSATFNGLARVAARLELTLGEAATRLRRLAPLGVAVPEVPDAIATLRLDDTDLRMLSRDLDGQSPYLDEVSWGHLVRVAARLELTLGEVAARLRRLAPLGVAVPEIPDAVVSLRPDDTDLRMLSRDLEGQSLYLDEVSWGHLVRVAARLKLTLGEAATRLRRLAPLGVAVPEVPDAVASLRPDDTDLRIASRDLDGQSPYLDEVSWGHLVRVAARLELTLGEAGTRLRRLAPLGVAVPEVPDAVATLRPDDTDFWMLSPNLDGRVPNLDEVIPFDILRIAAQLALTLDESAARLRRLLPPGMTLPQIPPGLAGLRPSDDDLCLLSRDLSSNSPFVTEVTPMHLVRVAAYLNLSLGEVAAWLARLEFLGLAVPNISENATTLRPDRTDLRLLSSGLGGQAPYVDEVTCVHVVLAMSRLGRPFEMILNRLLRLAPLGLKIPAFPPNAEADDDALILLSRHLDGNEPYISGPVRPGHLALASSRIGQTVDKVYQKLRRLQFLGIELPDVGLGDLEHHRADHTDLIALARDRDGNPPWIHGDVSTDHIARVAQRLNVKEEVVRARLALYAPLGLTLTET